MNTEELSDLLEIFLNPEKSKEVKKRLPKFGSDPWLINSIAEQIANKEMRNLNLDNFSQTVSLLGNIVMLDYPTDEPVKYSGFYYNACNSKRFEQFRKTIDHLLKIKEIDPSIPELGIQKSPNSGREVHVYEPSSYLFMLQSLMQNEGQNMIPFSDRLNDFEVHLKEIKTSGINPGMLMSKGYAKVIAKLDEFYHQQQKNEFSSISQKTSNLMKQLDERGFEILQGNTVSRLHEIVSNRKVTSTLELLEYLSKEAIMYLSGIHLKP